MEESLTLYREAGDKIAVAEHLPDLGGVELARDNLGKAERFLREGLELSNDSGHRMPLLSSLLGIANLSKRRGRLSSAARLFGFLTEAPEASSFHHLLSSSGKARLASSIGAVRTQMDESAWEEAYAKGRSMRLDEAVSYALKETEAAG
jgi:hypothetical protein